MGEVLGEIVVGVFSAGVSCEARRGVDEGGEGGRSK